MFPQHLTQTWGLIHFPSMTLWSWIKALQALLSSGVGFLNNEKIISLIAWIIFVRHHILDNLNTILWAIFMILLIELPFQRNTLCFILYYRHYSHIKQRTCCSLWWCSLKIDFSLCAYRTCEFTWFLSNKTQYAGKILASSLGNGLSSDRNLYSTLHHVANMINK